MKKHFSPLNTLITLAALTLAGGAFAQSTDAASAAKPPATAQNPAVEAITLQPLSLIHI